jgi:DNA-binding response OmpR family regulator
MSNVTVTKTKQAMQMLVVEDQGETCLMLDLILSDRKFEMNYVNNLLDADEYLSKNKPSVIILDNKLPDGFGVDFITYAKKKYPKIKIIMISGFSMARDVAMDNGADVFLEKPFSMQNVNEAIDMVLA